MSEENQKTDVVAALPPLSTDLDWPDDLTPFDPFDVGIQTSPYAHYRWMRANAPVIRAGNSDAPLYIVSRFADVTAALRNAAVFLSQPPGAVVPPGFLLSLDAPDHPRLRQMASKAFTPRAVQEFTPRIAELIAKRWNVVLQNGGGEVMGLFASPLTISVISTLLGVPVEHSAQMRDWTTKILDYVAILLRGVPGGADDAAYVALTSYIGNVLDAASDSQADNVVSNLARLRASGELTAEEASGFAALIFMAGHETTTLLTGNCLDFLSHNPVWLPFLRTEKGAAAFLNEMLRYRPPVHRLSRFVGEDTVLGGYRLPAGASVRLLVASANRDDTAFPDGDTFDPARSNAAHAAFGYGPHMCMGSWLARLEVRLILERIGATVSDMKPDPTIETEALTGGAFATVGLKNLGLSVTPLRNVT
ncbi:hypothetical protein ASG11_12745 [Sphingomonas sp. Leaf357]|uniref:cytochrome P450 n=1 Tax=Sphingomonas sp. Leaf357 TaxID=1736350 RepID=UPI0006F5F37B|nr:cytochrome P450 [Sphingomonas sp. Leaf357]KQS05009.1 hypothetical protein ASG11_12745 [Sphingomonas sp. Leaf357]